LREKERKKEMKRERERKKEENERAEEREGKGRRGALSFFLLSLSGGEYPTLSMDRVGGVDPRTSWLLPLFQVGILWITIQSVFSSPVLLPTENTCT